MDRTDSALGIAPPPAPTVRRRHVLYLHGFDPRGPGGYHAMYQEAAAASSTLTGRTVEVGPRRRAGPHAATWSIRAGGAGDAVETTWEFLRWDDLVRARWSRSEFVQFRQLTEWVGAWWRCGFFGKARRTARALWLAMLFPPVTVALFLLVMILGASLVGVISGLVAKQFDASVWLGVLPALGVLALGPMVWRRAEGVLNLCWLSRAFHYVISRRDPQPDVDERVALFSDRLIATAADPDIDEIMVVSHSLGNLHAIPMLAGALRANPHLGRDGRVALLTLGQPFAGVMTLPEAEVFREQMKVVADAGWIPWVDVTSASDPASACLLDPLEDVGVSSRERIMSKPPRFHLFLEPEHFRRVRRDPMRFHFLYLLAPDRRGGHDLVALTTSPRRLRDQLASRVATA